MSSKDSLLMRSLASEKKVRRTLEDAGVVLRITCHGAGSGTPTVVMSDTSSDITLTDKAGVVITADLSNAAYNTVGEVADFINGNGSWDCKIMDSLRSEASNNVWTDGAVTAYTLNGETVFDVTQLIAQGKLIARATYDESAAGLRVKGAHRVILNGFSTYATTTGGANTVQIFDVNNATGEETQIWGGLGINNTLMDYSSSSATYPFPGITASEGHDLVVVVAGTVTTAPTTNYLQVHYMKE